MAKQKVKLLTTAVSYRSGRHKALHIHKNWTQKIQYPGQNFLKVSTRFSDLRYFTIGKKLLSAL